MMPTQRVFICYAREDREWAEEIARILKGQRLQVLVDLDSARAGELWPESLRRELEAAGLRLHTIWSEPLRVDS